MAIERRRFGKTDMTVSVLGFGGSEIGYQRVSARTVARLLGAALDGGLNVIDTAECYDESEVAGRQGAGGAAPRLSTSSPSAATPREGGATTGDLARSRRASSGASSGSAPTTSTSSSSTAARSRTFSAAT